MIKIKWVLFSVLISQSVLAKEITVQALWYQISGLPSGVMNRYLFYQHWLRLDENKEDFLLYDAKLERLYTVTHESQSIILLNKIGSLKALKKVQFSFTKSIDTNAPKIMQVRPINYTLNVAGVACYHAVVLPLSSVMQRSLVDYKKMLANRHHFAAINTPDELLNDCDIAKYIQNSGHHINYGLPISEWDNTGFKMDLVDINLAFKVKAKLFELPTNYRIFKP